jgi:hypothetical protein
MDEMTPEEYRDKLQETISARQRLRREESLKSGQGRIGNMNSQNYLDQLGGGGGGMMKKGEQLKRKWHPNSVQESVVVAAELREQQSEQEEQQQVVTSEQQSEVDDDKPVDIESPSLKVGEEESKQQPVSSSSSNSLLHQQQIQQSPIMSQPTATASSQPESVYDQLKQTKVEKEISRKSEWQAIATEADDVPEPNEEDSSETQLAEEKRWFNENRQRPIPSSVPPTYSKVKDRFPGETKQFSDTPSKVEESSEKETKWYDEKRTRPIPSAEPPKHTTVSDRAGSEATRLKQSASKPPTSSNESPTEDSVWYDEKRTRPIPSAEPPKHAKVSDRFGAEQQTIKSPKASERTSSTEASPDSDVWYNERRARPIPSAEPPNHVKVYDRTGAETTVKPLTDTSQSSLLRSLLKDDKIERKQLLARQASPASVEWWNEKPHRPEGYVRHTTSISTTYESRPEHPKNYGDMTLSIEEVEPNLKQSTVDKANAPSKSEPAAAASNKDEGAPHEETAAAITDPESATDAASAS